MACLEDICLFSALWRGMLRRLEVSEAVFVAACSHLAHTDKRSAARRKAETAAAFGADRTKLADTP